MSDLQHLLAVQQAAASCPCSCLWWAPPRLLHGLTALTHNPALQPCSPPVLLADVAIASEAPIEQAALLLAVGGHGAEGPPALAAPAAPPLCQQPAHPQQQRQPSPHRWAQSARGRLSAVAHGALSSIADISLRHPPHIPI